MLFYAERTRKRPTHDGSNPNIVYEQDPGFGGIHYCRRKNVE